MWLLCICVYLDIFCSVSECVCLHLTLFNFDVTSYQVFLCMYA